MKSKRHIAILELIRDFRIDTQEDLQAKLAERGFAVTQATVSRDIRELNIVKSVGEDGVYKYRADSSKESEIIIDKYSSILCHAIRSVRSARNLVVVKTYTGMGNAVGAAVDAMDPNGCIGTIAGDDTVLMVASEDAEAAKIACALSQFIEKDEK